MVNIVAILGGTFSIVTENGPAIGGARYGGIGSFVITGGSFRLSGVNGIGCEYPEQCGPLFIGNATVHCSAISNGACLQATTVNFTTGVLTVSTPQSTFVDFQNSVFSGSPELRIQYRSTSVRELLIGLPIIHIERIDFLFPSIYELHISPSNQTITDFSRFFTLNSSEVRGLAFSVPSLGNYTISYRSRSPVETGYLIHDSMNSFAALANNDTFYSIATINSTNIACSPNPTAEQTVTASESPNIATDEYTDGIEGFYGKGGMIFSYRDLIFLVWTS
jgi:hypothetical protein